MDRVKARISASAKTQIPPRLLAVSKTQAAARIREAYAVGQREFGENYLQEALEKIDALRDLDIEWHFIGAIQSNKTREIATHFDWVQTVSRDKVARRLNQQRPPELGPLNVCIQVNLDQETSKSGVTPNDVTALAHTISQLERLRLRGLMIIPAPQPTLAGQRATAQRAHNLFQKTRASFSTMDTLSLGMSADLEAAIEAGSTMVRIGTDLFGARR